MLMRQRINRNKLATLRNAIDLFDKEIKKAKIKRDDIIIEVNKLERGYPSELHIWRNAHDRTETFTDKQLEFFV